MVALGDADCDGHRVTRNPPPCSRTFTRVIDAQAGHRVHRHGVVPDARRAGARGDTAIHECRCAASFAENRHRCLRAVARVGWNTKPRVRCCQYLDFGQPRAERAEKIRRRYASRFRGVSISNMTAEMAADVALNRDLQRNILSRVAEGRPTFWSMPAFHCRFIATKMLPRSWVARSR